MKKGKVVSSKCGCGCGLKSYKVPGSDVEVLRCPRGCNDSWLPKRYPEVFGDMNPVDMDWRKERGKR